MSDGLFLGAMSRSCSTFLKLGLQFGPVVWELVAHRVLKEITHLTFHRFDPRGPESRRADRELSRVDSVKPEHVHVRTVERGALGSAG